MNATTRMAMAAVPLLIWLGLIGAVSAGAQTAGTVPDPTVSGPLRCEITKIASGSLVTLAAVIHADAAVNGSYSFKVTSGGPGGSSNINQGGPFSAGAKAPVTLGTVMINANAAFDAALTVTAGDASVSCMQKAGAI